MRLATNRFLAGVFLALLALVAATAAAAPSRVPESFAAPVATLEEVALHAMPWLDNAALLANAAKRQVAPTGPIQVAHRRAVDLDLIHRGTFELLADGSRLWRLRIASQGALHLNLGFSHFDLPEGAALWIYNPAGDRIEGPYTARHRSQRGRLYTPALEGGEIVVELHVPARAEGPLDVRLEAVNHGFRDLRPKFHGPCNIDAVCPEGDPWRNEIRSAATYLLDGAILCSGQLLNNLAEDDLPLFLSAWHCGIEDFNADTLVVTWNFQAPRCGLQSTANPGISQTGSRFLATHRESDFVLVELSEPPPPEADVFLSGWDASGRQPQGSVAIHHPQGDVKSISFNDDPLATGAVLMSRTAPPQLIEGDTHWEVDNWELGTTEGGSSGSCVWDRDSQLCVGVLSAGAAACDFIDPTQPNDAADYYGKLSVAWEGGGTPESRLRDWLDPAGTGLTEIGGRNVGGGGCVADGETLCLQQRRFAAQVRWTTPEGLSGPGHVKSNSDTIGVFYFFSEENEEIFLKVLDACDVPDFNNFWVYAAGLTDLEVEITVTDVVTGAVNVYANPPRTPFQTVTDSRAFEGCPQAVN